MVEPCIWNYHFYTSACVITRVCVVYVAWRDGLSVRTPRRLYIVRVGMGSMK